MAKSFSTLFVAPRMEQAREMYRAAGSRKGDKFTCVDGAIIGFGADLIVLDEYVSTDSEWFKQSLLCRLLPGGEIRRG